MGFTTNWLSGHEPNFKKGFVIEDFLMFLKFIDYMENKIDKVETTEFHLGTFIIEAN